MHIYIRLLVIMATCFIFSTSALAKNLTFEFQVKGLTNVDMMENVQARLNELKKSEQTLTPQKIQAIYAQAKPEVEKALQPYGYFHAEVHSKLLTDNHTWTAVFDIRPGQAIKISALDVQVSGPGKNNAAVHKFVANLAIKVGDSFKTETYEKARDDLLQTAVSQGYIKASYVDNKVYVDLRKYQVTIVMHMDTGKRYYFGKVNFSSEPYSQDFLQKFVASLHHQPFSSDKLLQLQQDMSESAYFRQVNVTPDFDQANDDGDVPINMDVFAPKAKKYNFGIGYGTFTGPRLSAGINLNHLTDTGQHFNAQLKLSSVMSGLSAKYYIPGENPLKNQWLLGADYQRFMPKNGTSQSVALRGGYLTKSRHTETSMTLNYLIESYKVDHIHQPAMKTQLLYPNLNVIYRNSDDLIAPSWGRSINLNLRGASRTVLSSTNFAQAEVKGKYMVSPFDFAHILLNADLGYTTVSDLNKLPLSMRFFAGGLNSIRGYGDSSIGPGRYLYSGSVEYQQHIKNNWWGALFYDAGTATNHFDTPISQSTGIGAIYQSAVGPIKLYLARTLGNRTNHYGVEFSIGPEF